MYNVLLAKSYARQTNELFGQLSATTLISVKLNVAHQNLSTSSTTRIRTIHLVAGPVEELVAYAKNKPTL